MNNTTITISQPAWAHRSTLGADLLVIYVVCLRELKKFMRQRSRILGTLARPVIWLVLVGMGISPLVTARGPVSYQQFIFPGILGMTILFASIFSAISIVWDREFGFLKEMLVAPISRTSIVLGKALAGTLISTLQAAILALLLPVLGLSVSLWQILLLLMLSALVSFALTSLGIVVASFLSNFEGFNIIMNFMIMPMFFLSGAMYPVGLLPGWLKLFTYINPLTYGVDGFKNVLLGPARASSGMLGAEFPLYWDIIVVTFFSIIMITIAAWSFRRRE
jgi:ABC-2 type transport system permease protein